MRSRELIQPGGANQRERADVMGAEPPYLATAARSDVLSFRTAPLDADLEVTGPVTVTLWVSTDARDTDVTALLLDCYPPSADYPEGYALRLSDSIKRLRFRRGAEREELVRPGEVVEVPIELYPTSNLFATGHRIGVEISSSNYPRFDINPNTGEPIGPTHPHQSRQNKNLARRQSPQPDRSVSGRIVLRPPATAVTTAWAQHRAYPSNPHARCIRFGRPAATRRQESSISSSSSSSGMSPLSWTAIQCCLLR